MNFNKNFRHLIFIFIFIIFSSYFIDPPSSQAKVSSIETNELIKKEGAILVDVREEDEIKLGMARPARWMPLSRMNEGDPLFTDFLKQLPQNKLIILYCAAGKRAQRAQVELEKRGYRTANMGGYSEWQEAQLPTRYPEKSKQ